MRQREHFLTALAIISGVLAALAVNYFFYLEDCLNTPDAAKEAYRFNAMIIRFKTFDSIIGGSSMSQNFRCTEFDRFTGGTSYKLAISGCRISRMCTILEYAFRHQKVRTVLLDLHNALLLQSPPPKRMEDFYYQDDTGLLCDLRDGVSLWSLTDRRKRYLDRSKKSKRPPKTLSRDEMYCWAPDYPCGKAYLARVVARGIRDQVPADAISSPEFLEKNFSMYLLPLFRNHPEVTFYVFLPPFSPFAYLDREEWFLARKAVMDRLLTLPNVRVYDFQAAEEVCLNYDNYMDVTHYSAQINSWILRQIAEDRYLVTPENRAGFEARFRKMIDSFDGAKEVAAMKKYAEEHPVK